MLEPIIWSVWVGPLLWAVLYVSDYRLTIACARLYRAQDKVVFEGSYEITPFFQTDVNALRRVSPRFLIALVATTGYLILARVVTTAVGELEAFYQVLLGTMILTQATVHTRHLRNWYLFKRSVGFLRGRLEYPRGVLLRNSAMELLVFTGLYAGLFLVTSSVFVLGGALGAGAMAFNHHRLARRHEAAAARAA